MGGDLALLGAAFAFGIGSGILPVFLNAEVYVVGKAIVFELVRRGSSKVRSSVERKPPRSAFAARVRRLGDQMLSLLDRPYLGAATVMASSLFGVPPLAVVTILAGASRQPRWLFLTMVFVGRTAQFLAIAFLVHGVT